jgi:predicted methyltransferase MtxX (methanogen marker protein 4)
MIFNEKKKKLYAESASMIADMGVRGKLSVEEMNFLLSLLDIVVVKKDQPQLIQILQNWVNINEGSEIDEIIKATLLAADFNDRESMEQCLQLVTELLESRGLN